MKVVSLVFSAAVYPTVLGALQILEEGLFSEVNVVS
jgi:hypothetical protein